MLHQQSAFPLTGPRHPRDADAVAPGKAQATNSPQGHEAIRLAAPRRANLKFSGSVLKDVAHPGFGDPAEI